MASTYSCTACRSDLNLRSEFLYPPEVYFESGNKGTLSFSWIDDSKFRFEKENKLRPFFETINYWGIHRNRTQLRCAACGFLVGYFYDDGPPVMHGTGQFGFGPSQAIPRRPRYRFKLNAIAAPSLPA